MPVSSITPIRYESANFCRLGVPTEMIVLPRTPHGPREPKLQMEVSRIIMKWFDTHLRPVKPRVTTE